MPRLMAVLATFAPMAPSPITPSFLPISSVPAKFFFSFSAVFAIFFESFIDMDLMWADYAPVLVFLLVTIYSGASVIEEEANG